MTGQLIRDPGDGIWDDGEWISWDYINGQIFDQDQDEDEAKPKDEAKTKEEIFDQCIAAAQDYFEHTHRHLPIYGELGELFVELRYRIVRNKPYAEGSDGKLGNRFVEVKTIGPEKNSEVVQVKRSGNFGILVVVKIDSEFKFQARAIHRPRMKKGTGKFARVSWKKLEDANEVFWGSKGQSLDRE